MSTNNTTFIKSVSQKKSLKTLNSRSYIGGALSPIARSSLIEKEDLISKKTFNKTDKSNNRSMIYDDTGKNSKS